MISAIATWLRTDHRPSEPASQPRVIIYLTSWCSYCFGAKALLDRKSVAYEEIDIDEHPMFRARMVVLSGGRTSVPQIFIDDVAIGGCDDLHALEAKGHLDRALGR